MTRMEEVYISVAWCELDFEVCMSWTQWNLNGDDVPIYFAQMLKDTCL